MYSSISNHYHANLLYSVILESFLVLKQVSKGVNQMQQEYKFRVYDAEQESYNEDTINSYLPSISYEEPQIFMRDDPISQKKIYHPAVYVKQEDKFIANETIPIIDQLDVVEGRNRASLQEKSIKIICYNETNDGTFIFTQKSISAMTGLILRDFHDYSLLKGIVCDIEYIPENRPIMQYEYLFIAILVKE